MHASYDFKSKEGRPTFAAKDRRKYVFLLESYVVGQVFNFFSVLLFWYIFVFLEVSKVQPRLSPKTIKKKTLGGHDERS